MTLNDSLNEMKSNIEFYRKEMRSLKSEKNLKKIDLTVVSSITVRPEAISFWINKESDREEQRKVVNRIAQVYKVDLKKSKSFWKSSLDCEGTTEDGREINIYGYVPPTCQLVEVEEDATSFELEQAKKQLVKLEALISGGKKVVKQVVCA